jgi:hypothetical protein
MRDVDCVAGTNAVARCDQHVPEFREVRCVAERAVPPNNFGAVAGQRQNLSAAIMPVILIPSLELPGEAGACFAAAALPVPSDPKLRSRASLG